jgi:predicted GIY-YIG superfamily endonuclease
MLGRIYKLECEDSHYYIGSTVKETIKERLWKHMESSKTKPYKVYNHINKITWDKVKMILIKEIEVLSLEELHIEENKYINLDDILCLNTKIAYQTDEERKEYMSEFSKKWYNDNREHIKKYREDNKEHRLETRRLWYEKNKDKINYIKREKRKSRT